jgi:hypothetical protein
LIGLSVIGELNLSEPSTGKIMKKYRRTQDAERQSKKEQGFMVFGLKSFIKALEMADGDKKSSAKYRYQVDADASYAWIVLAADGTEVPETRRTRQEWAKIGRPARLASIALRATKDELDSLGRVEYTFNVVTGEGYVTLDDERLADRPQTVQEWAKIGAPLEKSLFEQLGAAREWGNTDAEETTREKMIKYGVIRRSKTEPASTEDLADS